MRCMGVTRCSCCHFSMLELTPFQALTSTREADLQLQVEELTTQLANQKMLMGLMISDDLFLVRMGSHVKGAVA